MTCRQPSILTPQKWVQSVAKLRAFHITLVVEWGRILGLLPGMGPSIRIRLSILPLLGACVVVTRFVEFYVTYTNTVIGHILWLPLSTIGTIIGGYLFLISTLDEKGEMVTVVQGHRGGQFGAALVTGIVDFG